MYSLLWFKNGNVASVNVAEQEAEFMSILQKSSYQLVCLLFVNIPRKL